MDAPTQADALPGGDTYRQLGVFIATFQWIDSQLAQLLSRIVARERWHQSLPIFAALSFKERLRFLQTMFALLMEERAKNDLVDAANWSTRFPKLINQCESLAARRNKLVHSTYVHFEVGGELAGVLRSKHALGKNPGLDQGDPLVEIPQAMELAMAVVLEVNFLHVQLIHWT